MATEGQVLARRIGVGVSVLAGYTLRCLFYRMDARSEEYAKDPHVSQYA